MRIGIVGAGGVGGYLGALLAQAGHEVALIARGEHLRVLRDRGITVRSVHGDLVAKPAIATDRPEDAGPVELLVVAVKTYDLDAAADAAAPMVGTETAVVPFQNGVDAVSVLRPRFGDRVLPGAVWIVSSIGDPGVIVQESQVRRLVIGEPDGSRTPRLERVHDALASSGCTVETTSDITAVLWTKLLFIASIAGLTSVTRASVGRILAVPEAKATLRRAMREVESVARAKGIAIEPDAAEKGMAFAAKLEPTATSSMARDVAAGRRSEYDALCGAVVRGGGATGVPTPVHELCWTCLRTMEPSR